MNTQMKFITKDEIKQMAPVAFSESPTREVSAQYVMHNTETVVDDLASMGWLPTGASQRTGRKGVQTKFSPHMIKFANPDIVVEGKGGDVSYPQIILQNRHDGLGSFKFMAGMFRLVCSNGLVVATSTFASATVPHKGYTFEELREVVNKRVESIPESIEFMNKMKERELNEVEKHKLALDALLLRSGIAPASEEAEKFQYDPTVLTSILVPNRKMDKGNDLWSVFNVVQEKMVKGGWNNGRRVKGIGSFEKDLALNKALFSSAMELVEPADYELVEA